MAASRICWILLTLITAGVCAFAGNVFVLALLGGLILLPVVMAAGNLAVKNKIKMDILCPVNMEKCEVQSIQIRVENCGLVPSFMVLCTVVITNELTGEQERVRRRTSALPGRSQNVEVKLSSRHCGRLRISAENIRIYDCFALVGVKSKCSAGGTVTVQPNTFYQHVSVTYDVNCPDDSEVYSQDKPGNDLTEPFQIRDYVPGDSMRQIHWKLTGKLDKLIVKDPSLPITRSVVVLWERCAEKIVPEEQDAQGEVAVSLCRALLENSTQFNLIWNNGETGHMTVREIRDMDDLAGASTALMSATPLTCGLTGAEVFCQTAGESAFSHIVYITEHWTPAIEELTRMGRVTVLLCGEQGMPECQAEAVCFNTEDYSTRLAELEI